MNAESTTISTPEGLERFLSLHDEAIEAIVGRFDQTSSASYEKFGAGGRAACREDIGHHLEFLRPALEFGSFLPFVDYVRWLAALLAARGIPADDLTLSLDWLREFFEARLPAEDAKPVAAALDAGLTSLRDASDEAPPYELLMPEARPECGAFISALVHGDQRTAAAIFREISDHGQRYLEAQLHLVQPAMYEIGRGWQQNRISVAQEHLATTMVHGLLSREFASAKPEPPDGRSVVLAAVEGNPHILGVLMVADAFELAGWDVLNLGPNIPTGSLVEMVRETRPNLVGLSASLPSHLRAAREAIASLRGELGEACPPVILGGLTINQFPPLAMTIGADATGSDSRLAVETAAQLVLSS